MPLALQIRSRQAHKSWLQPACCVLITRARRSFIATRPDLVRLRRTLQVQHSQDGHDFSGTLLIRAEHARQRISNKSLNVLLPKLAEHRTGSAFGASVRRSRAAGDTRSRAIDHTSNLTAINRRGRQPVRTKYVWLENWVRPTSFGQTLHQAKDVHPGPFAFDSSWTEEFHGLAQCGQRIDFSLPSLKPIIERFASRSLGTKKIHLAWMHVPAEYRLSLWKTVMLWCLEHSPRRALKLLSASLRGTQHQPPRHIIADCLQQLSVQYLRGVLNPDPEVLNDILVLTFKHVRRTCISGRGQYIPDQLVYLLLKNCTNGQFIFLLKVLTKEHVHLHANTLLHALTRCLDMGNITLSLKILEAVSESGMGMYRDQVMSACVRLVRAQFNVDNQFSIQTRILTKILKMGVRPNIILYNAILLNTTEAGHIDLAWRMLDLAKANCLVPDKITYQILLQGALAATNHDMCRALIYEMRENVNLMWEGRLKADVLASISRCTKADYPSMLVFYKDHWDIRPLIELGMCDAVGESGVQLPVEANGEPPPKDVLGKMICAYARTQRDSKALLNVYNRFYKLACQQHPLLVQVAQSDHVFNAFMMSFSQSYNTLPRCTHIVKNMLDKSDLHRGNFNDHKASFQLAAPTVRTWSILVDAFLRHRQNKAAEKVLGLMQERGMKPDQVTWNIIISGNSTMQNVQEAVDTLQRMQAAGFEPNAGTFKGLSYIDDHQLLLRSLRDTFRETNNVDSESNAASEAMLQDVIATSAEASRVRKAPNSETIWKDLQERWNKIELEQQPLGS